MSIPGSCHIMLVDKSDRIGTGALSADFTQGAEYKMILVHSLLGVDALKHAPPNTQTMEYPNDGVLKVLDSNQKSGLIPFQGCLSPREAEGLLDMSASSLLWSL